MMKKSIVSIAMLGIFLGAGGVAHADEVEDAIKEALESYQQQDYVMAKQALSMATQLINQLNTRALGQTLPEPLTGWEADEVAEQSQGAMMFGGGMAASREYRKANENLNISIMGDSPMLSQMMAIFQNPMIAGSMGKMTRIGKQMAMESKDGELTLVVANRFLITISGSASMDDKKAYAQEIDFDKLQEL